MTHNNHDLPLSTQSFTGSAFTPGGAREEPSDPFLYNEPSPIFGHLCL